MVCAILKLKASTVCPESVLPEASVIVPETIIEYQIAFVFYFFNGKSAALAFKVSKIVSTK
jgi:hypothetical protein